MSANSKNRQDVREAIAALLATKLVGTGLPAAEVAAYQKSKITLTPLVQVLSAGSSRTLKGLGTTKYENRFWFEIHVLIRDTDDTGLTDQEREDLLDLIDKDISDCLADNQSSDDWDLLTFSGGQPRNGESERSKATKVTWDGKAYLFEVFQVEVLVND